MASLCIHLQYYDDTYPTVKEQKAFEKNIFNKTHRTDSKIYLICKRQSLFQPQCMSNNMLGCLCVLRWDSITRGPHSCLQEQHRPLLLCDWKFTWKWGKPNFRVFCNYYKIINIILLSNPTSEQWVKSHKHKSTRSVSNPILSVTTEVIVW